MLDARVEFIKVFVEADLQYEDFDSTQLEVFIDQAVDLGIEIESVVDEREFYRIKRIINDMYEVYQEEDFDTNESEEAATIETNNNEEDINMDIKKAVNEANNKFKGAKENIKVGLGETKEEYINKVDDSLNIMKGALGDILNKLDTVLGYSMLKDSLLSIIESGTDGKSSKKDIFRMARKCRRLIEDEIDFITEFGDEEDFNKTIQLKALVKGDRDKSIFESFAVGCIWIVKKVARKLRKWYSVDEEKSLLKSVCRSIANFAVLFKAGVELIWDTVKLAVSFVISAAILLIDYILHAIKSVVSQIKGWVKTKSNKMTKDDVDEDIDDISEAIYSSDEE